MQIIHHVRSLGSALKALLGALFIFLQLALVACIGLALLPFALVSLASGLVCVLLAMPFAALLK